MNTEDLHIALTQSFNPDSNVRLPAEELIKSLKYVDGSSLMLLQIAAEKQVNNNIIIYITILTIFLHIDSFHL